MTPILGYRTVVLSNAGQVTPKQQRGFTLLEIILVLAIIATASVMVAPNLGGFEARTFSTQVRQAQSLLNYARRTAVISGQASTVSFNVLPVDEMGQIDEEEYASLSNIVAQWNGAGVNLRFRDSTDREIEIEEKTEVTFYPEGGSTGGTLLFAQEDQAGVIDIDPFTGRVSSGDPDKEL
jgi:general secretion pathway protein H|tara:strand:- start:584 stop:1123 length:540 start_codon:yes stop_codon:yes gene_type:complete